MESDLLGGCILSAVHRANDDRRLGNDQADFRYSRHSPGRSHFLDYDWIEEDACRRPRNHQIAKTGGLLCLGGRPNGTSVHYSIFASRVMMSWIINACSSQSH